MQKYMLTREAMLIAAIVAWGGFVAPQALAQRARVPQTGQTQCWDASGNLIPCAGTGQDGEVQAGVPLPTPRFQDNRDGTVTDKLTGLIWLKDATCATPAHLNITLADALQAAQTLAAPQCDLQDHSKKGDWRLPNVRELYSLIDYGFANPALSNAAGTGQLTEGDPFTHANGGFWTSTIYPLAPHVTFVVNTADGLILAVAGSSVWPVRGGD
jgi:hypothetical protein